MKRFWDGSDHDAGVDVSKGDNTKKAVSYVTKYVTKMNDLAHDSKWAYLSMVMWYFKVRSFNTRHVSRYEDVKESPKAKKSGSVSLVMRLFFLASLNNTRRLFAPKIQMMNLREVRTMAEPKVYHFR